MKLINKLMAGALGGLAGAVTMSLVRTVGEQAGLIEKPLPLYLENQIEARTRHAGQTGEKEERALAQSLHLAMGSFFGAGYGLFRATVGGPPLIAGPLYGLGVYTLNLAGIGPALNLTPKPEAEDSLTVGGQIMIHLLYGAVTAVVADRIQE